MTTRRRLGALVALLLALLLVAAPAAMAGGEEESGGSAESLGIREIDATNPEAVAATFFYQGNRNDLRNLAVRVNGDLVSAEGAKPLTDSGGIGVVLLIDSSKSMETDAAIERAKEAATTFVQNKGPDDSVAIVTFNETVSVAQQFTTDEALLTKAIDRIALAPGTALFDGVIRAAGLFEDNELQRNVVLLTDGNDTSSDATLEQATGALTESGTVLFAVGIPSKDFKAGDIAVMAKASGGQVIIADDVTKLESIYSDVLNALQRQYVVTFQPKTELSGPVDVTLTVNDQVVNAQYTAGSRSAGVAQIQPQAVAQPGGPAFLRSSAGLYLVLALVIAGVGLLVFTLGDTFSKDRASLSTALSPYSEGYVAADDDGEDDDGKTGMAQTQLVQRAVDFTGQIAESRGLLVKVEGMLERSNLPLRAPEALFFYIAIVVVTFLLVTAATANLILGVMIAFVVALIPPAVVNYLASRRKKQFLALLPDTLQLLSGTLRAGYSLMQGVEAVAEEVSEPMGRELRRVVTESRLGRPLEVSLDAVADRMASPDFAWAVMAIRIQREVGGNLSELLLTVAETMTERERLRRDISALTAEGKVSAIVLGILPVGLGFAMYVINPDYIKVLFERTVGQIALGVGIGLALVGFYWMKKMVEIEI